MMYVKLHKIAFVLLIIGGLNWGLELFDLGIGQWLGVTGSNIVYALVALSALYELFGHKGRCKECEKSMANRPMSQQM